MRNRGVGSWPLRRARSSPDRAALAYGERSWTWRELTGRVARLANGLRSLGVGRDDRIAWLGSNHPAFLETLFAAGTMGAVMVPVNHRLGRSDVEWILADAGARALVARQEILPAGGGVTACVSVDGPAPGALDYEELLASASDDPIDEPVGLDDLCMLPYTSGTTGRPKGVMLTHGNVTWNAVNMLSSADLSAEDVTLAIAPFWRTGGTGVNVLPLLFKGGTVVVPASLDPGHILGLIERHRVTVGFAGPDLLEGLPRSGRWATADLSSIRFFITGGAPVPERLIRAWLDRGVTFLPGYGLSEAAPVALLLDREDMLRKVGSAGKPPLLVDVRVVGEDGLDVAPGETGELLVSGPNVMAGYWNRPEATAVVLTPDGWLETGDAARCDEEGFVWIVGRVADAYRCRGVRVFPSEVEEVLAEHPAVADAAVVGVPDEEAGEVGVAFVVSYPGVAADPEEILAWSRAQLPGARRPARMIAVADIPRNPAGKILRGRLREAALREGA